MSWLIEPTVPDDTLARRGEHTLDWLARSTHPRAKEVRRFLNESLSVLPANADSIFLRAFRERWASSLFEIIVYRMLHVIGASIQIEEENTDGTRPDYTVNFSNSTVIVEATAPIYNASAGVEFGNYEPLLEIIERELPPDTQVMVMSLPQLGPADSKKRFREAVRQLGSGIPLSGASQPIEAVTNISEGEIHLIFFPGRSAYPRVLCEPAVSFFDNSQQRIVSAVRKKRKQARNAAAPVLLAIQGGIATDWNDFDMALFGHTYEI
jgi:hypothetical protein